LLDGFRPHFLGGIPISSPLVQLGELIAKLRLEALLQIFRKKWMVAKPPTFLVQRSQKQLLLLD
jgi:hypothetical protein